MTTTPAFQPLAPPPPESLRTLLDSELSVPSRVGHVALLLGASLMTTVVVSLWATEPVLPVRTQAGFALMTVVGVAWATFAAWVLRHRRPLYARHHVIAGRMAVLFTSLFVIAALAVGVSTGARAAYVAATAGLSLAAAAVVILVRAMQEQRRLVERRAILARERAR